MSSWDGLSMAQRAEVMKLAVQNGIRDLDTIRGAYNEFAKGGDIHIDPSKKGTFTAAASRHNMGVQEFASKVLANKDDYSSAMVKKANFARNASKWKHGFGGNLYGGGGNVIYGKPYYSYDENGHKIDDTLNYNAILPEVIVTPDSKKSPGERATLERNRRRNHDTVYGQGTYDALRSKEWTDTQINKTYDAPQTFAGRMAQVLGSSPHTVRGFDVGSSIVQMIPKVGIIPAALDLGMDANRMYHKEDGATSDTMLDTLSALPMVSKLGLKRVKPKNVKQYYDNIFQPARDLVNTTLFGAKVADTIDDTYGANRTSDLTGTNEHRFGGNLFEIGGDTGDAPNIFRRPDGSYFYSADGTETDVTPMNTLGDNPAYWTYTDAAGKTYTPKVSPERHDTLTEAEDTNPLARAANNYFRELNWRAKNDPSSIALQGKYNIPLALSPMIAPLGEAAVTGIKTAANGVVDKVRQRLYDKVDPYSYNIPAAISQFIFKGRDTEKGDIYDALWARYLNRSNEQVGYDVDSFLQPADYTLTRGKSVGKLYKLTSKAWDNDDDLNPLGDRQLYEMLKSGKKSDFGDGVGGTKTGLGTYTRSLGEDERGKYMSYYDEWDISPIGKKSGKEGKDQSMGIGTPFSVYDRRYYTDDEAKHILSEYDKMFQSIADFSKNQSVRREIYNPKPYKTKK